MISVIMPARNAEPWVRQALDSIVNQSYADLEIIVIDDGSTDGTPAILAEYAARDPRIVLILHTETWGRGATRNQGLDLATGEFVSFVDADDWQTLDRYEKMLARAEAADLVFSNVQNYFGPHRSMSPLFTFPPELVEGLEVRDWARKDYCFRQLGTLCARLVRTRLIREHNLRFPDVRETGIQFEDVLFHYRSVAAASRVVCVDECLYTHRRHPRSVTGIFSENPELFFDCFQTWRELERSGEPRLMLYQYLHVFRHYLTQVDSSCLFYRRVKRLLARAGLRREEVPEHLRADYDFFRHFPLLAVLRAKLVAVKLGPQPGRFRLILCGRKVIDTWSARPLS